MTTLETAVLAWLADYDVLLARAEAVNGGPLPPAFDATERLVTLAREIRAFAPVTDGPAS